MTDYTEAVEAIREHLDYIAPETENEALAAAQEALEDYINNSLIYTSDILEAWDGGTHEMVDISDYTEIMEAITASTFYQLREDLADSVYDALDEYITDKLSPADADRFDNGEIDRDEALELING